MLDQFIFPFWYRWSQWFVDILANRSIKAWQVSLFGVGCVLVCVLLILTGHTYTAVAFLMLSRIADGLDGAVARKGKPHALGALIDSVADFICYGAIVAAFALTKPENIMPGIFLLLSFYVSGGSFLALAAIQAKEKSQSDAAETNQVRKGFLYDRGFMEGTETIAFFIAFMIFPDFFPVLAWIFSILCLATIGLRLRSVSRL